MDNDKFYKGLECEVEGVDMVDFMTTMMGKLDKLEISLADHQAQTNSLKQINNLCRLRLRAMAMQAQKKIIEHDERMANVERNTQTIINILRK